MPPDEYREQTESLSYWAQNALRSQGTVLPDRATVINDDDVRNVTIAVNTAKSVDELIALL